MLETMNDLKRCEGLVKSVPGYVTDVKKGDGKRGGYPDQ
jgi:hypothetical protein